MTRARWLLLGVIVAELVGGGYLAARRLRQPTPPLPELSSVDTATADEVRGLVARCRTPQQWGRLGEVYLATGFFPEAEACLGEASRLAPSSAESAFKHAFALERLGELDEANARYEAAAALGHPRLDDCWYYVGKNHLRLEREGEAVKALRQAVRLPGARYELALLDARDGRAERAEAEAGRLSKEFPQAYQPVSLRYRLALARNETAAVESLADLFARGPKRLPVPFDKEVDWVFGIANGVGQSRLLAEAGQEMRAERYAAAEEKLQAALAAGWNPEIADRLAEALFLLGREDEAASVLEEAITRGRPAFDLLWRLGLMREARGKPDEALRLWERAARVATGPAAAGLWQTLADRYVRDGAKEKAKLYQSRARLEAGLGLLDAGIPEAAIPPLKQAVEADPRSAQAWFFLAEACRVSSKRSEARSAYERCLQLNPDHGRAIRGLKLLDR